MEWNKSEKWIEWNIKKAIRALIVGEERNNSRNVEKYIEVEIVVEIESWRISAVAGVIQTHNQTGFPQTHTKQ